MLPEEIKQLIWNTPRKERKITTPTELHAVVKAPLIFQCYIIKPKQHSLLHHIRVHTPTSVRTFYYLHGTELLNILKHVHTQELVNA